MELGLEGKVAIVTGGARGIGKSIAEGFAREGCNVVISDILSEAAQKTAKNLAQNGIKALAVETDVSQKASADNLAAVTIKEFGRIDILVNAAGIVRDSRFVDIEEEEWDQILNINAKGVYLVTKAVVPHMIAARAGKIVNISSRSGKEAQAGLSHYGASKFAVIGLTQALAKELAEYNINVNAVCPGILHTDMWEKILDARSARTGLPREEIWARMLDTIPLKRPQLPEDIANVVLFLCSEVSRNITGEAINVNGGARMD
ncbi:MAG TPA: SDR family oxidoreductase [Dehalococcoidia bacterium]|jgi:NAD(P)-dependent dehydrogenase (short-subunit alcohol dehydrogenase family)|nr:SDR family oxidoreductase [Dehalococcoidia bacterium]